MNSPPYALSRVSAVCREESVLSLVLLKNLWRVITVKVRGPF